MVTSSSKWRSLIRKFGLTEDRVSTLDTRRISRIGYRHANCRLAQNRRKWPARQHTLEFCHGCLGIIGSDRLGGKCRPRHTRCKT